MARDFARAFYSSKRWRYTREAYKKYCGGVCERCEAQGRYGVAGVIVHHKIHLTADNINDPMIALDFNNLELLCRECHKDEHAGEYGAKRNERRYIVDENGNVTAIK